MMRTLKYPALAYKQATDASSPWGVSFVSTAEEVLTWTGIPRRSDKGLVGFRRLDEEPRVRRAKEFFDKPQNQSPTALMVGIHNPGDEDQRRIFLEYVTLRYNDGLNVLDMLEVKCEKHIGEVICY